MILLIAELTYRNGDAIYYRNVGVFNTPEEACVEIVRQAMDVERGSFNPAEDGGGTRFRVIEKFLLHEGEIYSRAGDIGTRFATPEEVREMLEPY